MKRVITYGTFDLMHNGHIKLLQRAKALGDFLIVGLSTDQFNTKKHKDSFLSYEHRKSVLEAIRYVDLVIPEESWEQKVEDIKKYEINTFTIGDDWDGEFDYLKDICEIVYLKRTDGISSTMVKKDITNKYLKN
jgi:glycerol-3-phosphate cytidylyltransferase